MINLKRKENRKQEMRQETYSKSRASYIEQDLCCE